MALMRSVFNFKLAETIVRMKKVPRPKSLLSVALGSALLLFAGFLVQQPPTPVHAAGPDLPSGAALFHEKGCEHCHGLNGVGISGKGPSLLTVGKRLKKDAIEKQIHDGGQNMPAFGDSLQPDEITALVDMLSKQKKAPKHLPPPPPPQTTPQPQIGAALVHFDFFPKLDNQPLRKREGTRLPHSG
jgi:mono/diheme cytochrome c family protein